MGTFHYLNVKQGDCSVIEHPSGHVTIVDVCNASPEDDEAARLQKALAETLGTSGSFNQKKYPVNPITYLQDRDIDHVFRFVLTHPDMDHMDGIQAFFEAFAPTNFWDTDNNCEKDFEEGSPYNQDDWLFYTRLRDQNRQDNPKRLRLFANARGKYYNQTESGEGGGDGLHILAPTKELLNGANESGEHNDGSYVLLYRSAGGRILMVGDSHDKTWEHILENHEADVQDVDVLIAPHHGRASGRSYDFLDVVNPTVTFFGNANSEHLAYGAWHSRELPIITNNQAGCMIVDTSVKPMRLYVTNKKFAETMNPGTTYSSRFRAYFCGEISR